MQYFAGIVASCNGFHNCVIFLNLHLNKGLMQLQQLNTYATTLCFGLLNPLGPTYMKQNCLYQNGEKVERSHAPSPNFSSFNSLYPQTRVSSLKDSSV